MCYHVAPSGAGGKEGRKEGGGLYDWEKSGDGKVKRGCGEETGGELNSSSKAQNVTVLRLSWGGAVMQTECWEFGYSVCRSEWALAG